MSDEQLIENYSVFFAYFCYLIDQDLIDSAEEWCILANKLDDEISRRKITDTAIEEWMKNVQLAPQDQLMVAAYIYPESDLFNLKIGQS